MNSASSTPFESSDADRLNGFIQLSEGVIDPAGWFTNTFTSAQIEKPTRITISAASITNCVRADSSMPIQQITVIATMYAQPRAMIAHVLEASASRPNSEYV